jgi:hypothetical protein
MINHVDIAAQKMQQALSCITKHETDIYRQAMEKRFGDSSEDTAKKCSLVVAGSVKRLMHGYEILCEIYPPTLNTFQDSSLQAKFSISHNYRIF